MLLVFTKLAIVTALFFFAWRSGRALLPSRRPLLAFAFGLLLVLAVQSVFQSLWYYIGWLLGTKSDAATLALTIAALSILKKFRAPHQTDLNADTTENAPLQTKTRLLLVSCLLSLVSLLAAFFVFRGASIAATTNAIRTPWPLLPHGTLLALSVIALCAWALAWATARSAWVGATALSAMLSIGSTTLLAPIIYKLGFGFDGFLHRASESVLMAAGTLNPHPPYYLGQYVFVTWISRVFGLSLRGTDTLLVPLSAAVLLPLGCLIAFGSKRRTFACAGLAALLPLSLFVSTTPQSFAYILGLLAVLTALSEAPWILPLSLAGWTLAAHPLAGLPFLGVVLLLFLIRIPTSDAPAETLSRRKIFRAWQVFFHFVSCVLVIMFAAASVPLTFYFSRAVLSVQWNFSRLWSADLYRQWFESLSVPTALTLWSDWAAFTRFLFPAVIVLLTIVASVRHLARRKTWIWLGFASLAVAASGLVMKAAGNFSFLIEYERGDYADRLFIIAGLLLIPPALDGLASLAESLMRKPRFLILYAAGFLMAWQGAQAYTALPRHDASVIGHGWSVGQADVDAVRWIARDAGDEPYAVLANQTVSAASVGQFGFKRYGKNPETGDPIFYYPIPTGGPLYQLYLDAVSAHPLRDTMKRAARMTQSTHVYVVLNEYWWKAAEVDESLSAIADRKEELGNGKVKIYVFDVSKDKNR